MEHDEIVEILLEGLRKTGALKRRHASFWNSYKKSVKELGIGSELFSQLQTDLGSTIVAWGLCEKDPPDIRANLTDQRSVGIEVTELVNEAAIDAQIANPTRYYTELSRFGLAEAVKALRKILRDKEQKLGSLKGYANLVLIIHTDEPFVRSDQFLEMPEPIFTERSAVFDVVYLLFSYEPSKQKCPILKLL
jgi:hypothetical protein